MQQEKEAPFTPVPVPNQLNRDTIGALYSKSSSQQLEAPLAARDTCTIYRK